MMLAGLPVPEKAVDALARVGRCCQRRRASRRLERALDEDVNLLALT